MGLRKRLLGVLDRGAPPTTDPDEVVDLVEVEMWRSELIVTGLRDRGVPAIALPSSGIPEAPFTHARIQIRRRDYADAEAALDELLGPWD
jgi:hypothetical protein